MSTITEKLISSHLVEGTVEPGHEIGIKIDNTLIQDSTGTLAALQLEAIGVPRVETELSVCFVDHNTLQNDFRNMDDHKYLQTISSKYGLIYSRPGNGICHQVFLERFAKPGKTLLGSDSHTTTAGGIGCLAFGTGGLDVAATMAGEPYYLVVPKIIAIELTGKLQPMVSAKDIILEVLRRINVTGGRGKILEYIGEGVKTLSAPERATITNMGTETGATSSLFSSDEETKRFLAAQDRENDWVKISPDPDAYYSEIIHINLETLEPLIALPHSPGNVKKVSEIEGIPVDQVCIGSCTNSSLKDLKTVANMLKDNRVHSDTSLTVSPGSRQVLTHLAHSGELKYLLDAGARILECTCGPCIGMGQAPSTNSISLRTFNRNFKGRSGTESASVYLVSPETAAASAINGVITEPTENEYNVCFNMPEKFLVNDNLLIYPSNGPDNPVIRGPNIKPLPTFQQLPQYIEGKVLLKLGDNITTDHILPAGAKLLPLRSNIPKISKYVFNQVDPPFYTRATTNNGGLIVGGENYGQGSSREHAALAPKYLGIKAVIAKSFSRIHESNLVNFGIMPLIFNKNEDYEKISQGNTLKIDLSDSNNILVKNTTNNKRVNVFHNLSSRNLKILKAGGKLPYIRNKRRKNDE